MTDLQDPLVITFKPLQEKDFPLLQKWLNSPHLKDTWGENLFWSLSSTQEKYLSYTKGYKIIGRAQKPIHPFIININEVPIGFIQYYNAFDFPRDEVKVDEIWKDQNRSLAALDVYLGEPLYLSKGIGSKVVRKFLEEVVFNDFSACLVDPSIDNLKAIHAYTKAGFYQKNSLEQTLIMIAEKKI